MDLIHEHCAHLRRLGRRPGSIQARLLALRRFERWAAPHPIMDASLQELRGFIDRPGRGNAAIAGEVSHLREFYRWLIWEDLRVDDPTVRLERPVITPGRPRPMPIEDATFAITHAPERINPWLRLAVYAGMRACEIGPARGEHVRDDWLLIPVQKGGKSGMVRITPPLRPLIDSLPRSGWWFPRRDALDGPTSAHQVSHLANRWLHEQDIAHTLHTLRHRYGTNVRRVSGDLLVAQRALRHASIQSTVIYTDIEDDELGAAIDGIPDLGLKEAA